MARTLLLSGFDLLQAELPDDARLLLPPMPLPGLASFKEAATMALEEPIQGEPLAALLNVRSRVCIGIDDPSFPVPAMSRDCRREMLDAVLKLLLAAGVRANRVTTLVANGLSRQWRNTELTELFGLQSTAS